MKQGLPRWHACSLTPMFDAFLKRMATSMCIKGALNLPLCRCPRLPFLLASILAALATAMAPPLRRRFASTVAGEVVLVDKVVGSCWRMTSSSSLRNQICPEPKKTQKKIKQIIELCNTKRDCWVPRDTFAPPSKCVCVCFSLSGQLIDVHHPKTTEL